MKVLYANVRHGLGDRTYYGVSQDEWTAALAPFTESARSFIANMAAHSFDVLLMEDGRIFLAQPYQIKADKRPYSYWIEPGKEARWGTVERGTDEEVDALYETIIGEPNRRLFDLGDPRP